ARTRLDRDDLGAQQLHAVDIERLPAHVLLTHVDLTGHAETRGDGGRGNAVLTSTGFGDDALLAHVFGEQTLADGVVHLVRAGVIEILSLQVNLRAAEHFAPAFGVVQR